MERVSSSLNTGSVLGGSRTMAVSIQGSGLLSSSRQPNSVRCSSTYTMLLGKASVGRRCSVDQCEKLFQGMGVFSRSRRLSRYNSARQFKKTVKQFAHLQDEREFGQGQEAALRLFSEMQQDEVESDRVTLASSQNPCAIVVSTGEGSVFPGKIVEMSVSSETNRDVEVGRGFAVGHHGILSQSGFKKKRNSFNFILGIGVLVLGLGFLRFSKPAFAANVVTSTVTAVVDDKGEVKVEDTKLESEEITDSERTDSPGMTVHEEANDEKNDEPPFGEGSDLTSDPAEILLRSYLDSHPTDTKALQALLFTRLKKGEVHASLPVLTTLIELEPDNLEWKYMRAQSYEFAGNLPESRRGYEEVLESKPLSARALQGLTIVMLKMGDSEEALELLGHAVQKAVDSGQTKEVLNLRMLLGQFYTMQGDVEKAMELYKMVSEEDPTDYRPYLCQGLVYIVAGDEAEAERQFQLYRKFCPKEFAVRGFLDELMLQAKRESKILKKQKKEEAEHLKKGQKLPPPMRQPLADGSKPFEDSKVGS